MGKSDFQGNISSKGNGFDKRPELINRKGRPETFIAKLERLAPNGTVVIEENRVKKIEKDGKGFYSFEVPTSDSLMMRLLSIAQGKQSKDSMLAIRYVFDQLYGKAKQTIEQTTTDVPLYDISKLTKDEQIEFDRMICKMTT